MAAAFYSAKVRELTEEEESTEVFDTWFYASLGACDLARGSHEHAPDIRQASMIRAAIDALPKDAAERHIAMIASSLFSRMSGVNPAVKFNYLRGGFTLLGDERPEARQARQVYDYYKDLVKEIRLEVEIDGTDVVGHEEPFGVFVNIRHTKEIERESGGFSKYLQNQNNQMYSFNYGRPTENYRERFQETVGEVMQEHFEIRSITFHDPKVESRGDPVDGWRITPYAYILLEARGPEVDRIPALEMDFDFLDTSGYAVIPIESAPVPLDASGAVVDERPLDGLEITQTLDERQAEKGHLIVEVKATGRGLVPDLDELLDLSSEQFEVTKLDDQGLAAMRMDGESQDNVVLSERVWMIEMRARDGLAETPSTFRFAASKMEDARLVYQRYVDADLDVVTDLVDLEESYGQPSYMWAWALGGVVLLLGVGVAVIRRRPKVDAVDTGRFRMPADVTPFTILALLRRIREEAGVADSDRKDLDAVIVEVERQFFREESHGELDLRAVAEGWLRRVA